MAVVLSGIVNDLTSLIPSSSDVLQQVLLGAGASVVLSGLKTQAGVDAVDPLHLFHKDGGSTVVGKTLPASVVPSLSPEQIAAYGKAGYSFV